jgi:hypothetical protein
MKTLFGIGLGVVAVLSVASLARNAERMDLQSDEWHRKHRWAKTPVPMDEEELENHWYEWAA